MSCEHLFWNDQQWYRRHQSVATLKWVSKIAAFKLIAVILLDHRHAWIRTCTTLRLVERPLKPSQAYTTRICMSESTLDDDFYIKDPHMGWRRTAMFIRAVTYIHVQARFYKIRREFCIVSVWTEFVNHTLTSALVQTLVIRTLPCIWN